MTLLPKPVKPAKVKARLRHSSKPVPRRSKLKRGKAPRRMKRGKTAEMKRECRRLASAITKAQALGWCLLCIPVRWHEGTDAAHIWAKGSHPAIEFELDNLVWLARECHERVGSVKYAEPGEMRDLAIETIGRERFEELHTLTSRKRRPISDILAELRRKANALGVL